MYKYKVIDLFAGAGGLSLGFRQTGRYEIKAAFENSPYMKETYHLNHPDVDLRDDVCKADYNEIKNKYGPIDVVIGGPPCQGFSNANRQKHTAISKNNMLVKEYVRAITELSPKAFVMENVSMLRSDVHKFYLDEKDADLVKKYDIPTKKARIHLLDTRFMFSGILEYTTDISLVMNDIWNDRIYDELNIIYKASKNPTKFASALEKHRHSLTKFAKLIIKQSSISVTDIADASAKAFMSVLSYYSGTFAAKDLKEYIEPAIMYQRMLAGIVEINNNHLIIENWDTGKGLTAIIKSYTVYDYLKAILGSSPNNYSINTDILCAADYGAPQKRMRFVMVGIKKSIVPDVMLPKETFRPENYCTVRDAIADLADVKTVTSLKDDIGIKLHKPSNISQLGQILRDSPILRNHIITKTTDVAMSRFRVIKQGQNFHSLKDSLKINTYTDAARTQNTIYLRLNYDAPSGTVVNVRKSMWIHPVLDRAISVREAARLQTFPDSFIFCGSKDRQYQQVGNAVPPIMAKAIAKTLTEQLDMYLAILTGLKDDQNGQMQPFTKAMASIKNNK